MFTYSFEGHESFAPFHPLIYAAGHVEYDLVDNSFDYSGTHCTHGLDGTHDPGASADVTRVVMTHAVDEDASDCEWHECHANALREQFQEQHQETLVEYAFQYIQDEKADRDYDNYKQRQDED